MKTPRKQSRPRERVQVVVRMRPEKHQPDAPMSEGRGTCAAAGDDSVVVSRPFAEDRPFRFDGVLGPEAGQLSAYEVLAAPAVQAVFEGVNGTVLCYGQTGTGKTHTVFGSPELDWSRMRAPLPDSAGLVPRAALEMARYVRTTREAGGSASLTASFLQIYNEQVDDLFDLHGKNLAVREDPKEGVYTEGLFQLRVDDNAAELLEAVAAGARSRTTAGTALNSVSSRSHAVLTLTLDQSVTKRAVLGEVANGTRVRRSTLTIVDLAGSERVSKSRSSGARLEEAKNINRSISALGNCVLALADPARRSHVPLRESRLTRLLSNSLGGNSKTTLCATLAPEEHNFDESFTTLQFAHRSMAVQTHATVNERLVSKRPGLLATPSGPPTPTPSVSASSAPSTPSATALEMSALRRELAAAHAEVARLRQCADDDGVEALLRAEISTLRGVVANQQEIIQRQEQELLQRPAPNANGGEWAKKLGAALAAVPELRSAMMEALP